MLLYIVRHGETDWNKAGKVQGRTDIPLNERGRYLAEATAEGMKDVRIDFCYTSPLIRAKETAQIILGEREIPLVEEKRITCSVCSRIVVPMTSPVSGERGI